MNPNVSAMTPFIGINKENQLCNVDIDFAPGQFASGVLDLRFVPDMTVAKSFPLDSSMYVLIFETLDKELYNLLQTVPCWMVIGDLKHREKITKTLYRFLSSYHVTVSEYIPSKAKTYLWGYLSRSTAKKTSIIGEC